MDFPRRNPLPAAQQEANNKLRDQYKVRGYPTLVFLGKDGKELDRQVGYGGGGPETLIKRIEAARKQGA
ncbi:MAG: hypothetical protein H7A46_13050 [Verrucomicrobiales bacterium]|nr:hypothetical protein [Verrucomicrobiales bacterium]